MIIDFLLRNMQKLSFIRLCPARGNEHQDKKNESEQ
jgi:hypothetical protein